MLNLPKAKEAYTASQKQREISQQLFLRLQPIRVELAVSEAVRNGKHFINFPEKLEVQTLKALRALGYCVGVYTNNSVINWMQQQ